MINWRSLMATAAAIPIVVILPFSIQAQAPVTFRYFYDDLNQLAKVIDSSGVLIQYVYDQVGNILQILRSTVAPNTLAIFSFTPQNTPTGGTITIYGQGFSDASSDDIVTVNGVVAQVLSANATTLTIILPGTATSGPITITVGGVTVTSTSSLIIVPTPTITSILPKSALAGSIISASVTGFNLTGAQFAFNGSSLTPLVVIDSASIDPSGTSASLTLTISPMAQGRFTLVATSSGGTSDSVQRLGFIKGSQSYNALTVPGSDPNADPDFDGLTNAQEITAATDPLNLDTDGDMYSDGLEVFFGSDPRDPTSIPNIASGLGGSTSVLVSMLNTVNPGQDSAGPQTSSLAFSMLNFIDPAQDLSAPESAALTFSMLNMTDPSGGQGSTLEPFVIFSMLNAEQSAEPSLKVHLAQDFRYVGPDGELKTWNGPATLTALRLLGSTPAARRRLLAAFVGLDSDGDGLPDGLELMLGSDPFNNDSDGDGLPDGIEYVLKGDPFSAQPEDDDDRDGLKNMEEVFRGTDPSNPDTDGDGLTDGEETLRYHTDPLRMDSDEDGFPDGLEVALGTDPLDKHSFPDPWQLVQAASFVGPFSVNRIPTSGAAVRGRQESIALIQGAQNANRP